jgi:hypothetical protein
MTDQSLDAIYDRADDLFKAGRWSEADAEIAAVAEAEPDADDMIAWLTVGRWAPCGKLPSLPRLFRATCAKLMREYSAGETAAILTNLKPERPDA